MRSECVRECRRIRWRECDAKRVPETVNCAPRSLRRLRLPPALRSHAARDRTNYLRPRQRLLHSAPASRAQDILRTREGSSSSCGGTMPDDSPRDNISTSGHPAISIDSGRGDHGGEQSEQPSLTPAALTTLRPARGASAFTLIGRNVLRGDKTGIPHQPTPTLSLPSRPPSRAKDRHRPVHGGAAAAEAKESRSGEKGPGDTPAGKGVSVGDAKVPAAEAPVTKTAPAPVVEKPSRSTPVLPFSPESIKDAAAILRSI